MCEQQEFFVDHFVRYNYMSADRCKNATKKNNKILSKQRSRKVNCLGALFHSHTIWMVVSQTNWRRQCTCITWTAVLIPCKNRLFCGRWCAWIYELFSIAPSRNSIRLVCSHWNVICAPLHLMQHTFFSFAAYVDCGCVCTYQLFIFIYHVCTTRDAPMHRKFTQLKRFTF